MNRPWPHEPSTPQPGSITLTTPQAQAILRALINGFANTNELRWIATQLGPDHLAHPYTPNPEVDRILNAINTEAQQDRDHYTRGWNQGRWLAERAHCENSYTAGYETGWADHAQGNKHNPHPPDETTLNHTADQRLEQALDLEQL